MLTHLRVKDFQSLAEADIELGLLTVFIGPSNTGKSACLRAIKTLAHNSSSTQFVREGAKRATIEAELPGHVVSVTRGPSLSSYTVDGEAFAKTGKDVPPQAASVLQMPAEAESINFAGQFDPPFLLASTPSQVARTLGDLTNISLVMSAAREANRRHLAAGTTLKLRRADDERLTEKAKSYGDMGQAKARLHAETLELEKCREKIETATALLEAADRATLMEKRVELLREEASRLPQPLPDLTDTEKRLALAEELHRLASNVAHCEEAIAGKQEQIETSEASLAKIEEATALLLSELGTCPTCGQVTKDMS